MKKRLKTLLTVSIVCVCGLITLNILLLATVADAGYGKIYTLQLSPKDGNGQDLHDVHVDVKCWVDQDAYVLGDYTVKESDGVYRVRYRYHRLKPAISFRAEKWPVAFSLSLEKEGFEEQTRSFSLDELYGRYLEEESEDEAVFLLPDFVMKQTREDAEGTQIAP